MNTHRIDIPLVGIELSLDDSCLPTEHLSTSSGRGVDRIRDLTAEREAAYRQMQRLMQDIRHLRARGQQVEVSRQTVMADMMFRMALASEARKGGGVEHVVRMGVMSALLANEMGWSSERCDAIQLAAPVYDMGWAALPDYWQDVDDRDPGERKRLQAHCLVGQQLLGDSADPAMAMAATVAGGHHERHNGQGYPAGLAGDAIPAAARIVGCIDVFNTLIHGSGEQAGLSPEEAMEQVLSADSWFHPALRRALGHIRELLLAIHNVFDPSMLNNDVRAAIRRQWRPGFWRRFLN